MKSTEKNNVRLLSDMINNMTFDEKEFCKLFSREHRTLQQSFTRLCIEWLKTCASDDYRYDLRNEESHKVASKLMKDNDGSFLPFI